jgi:uncharacterized protein (DUF1800 family)
MESPIPARLASAIAAHRFGLGEPGLDVTGGDARGWLLSQIGPAGPQLGHDLASGAEALRRINELARQRRAARPPAPMAAAAVERVAERSMDPDTGPAPLAALPPDPLRGVVQADVRARLNTAALSERPFNERLALFWANHFTVSSAKGSARGLVGAFEREAIRPHIAGSFEDLLRAAVTHVGMLRYLDNENSAGPDSRVVQRLARLAGETGQGRPRITGLNENLAREVLELHTLGVDGGYTQADVTLFACVLTGWRVPLPERLAAPAGAPDAPAQGRFDPAWHQPGAKTVLGKRYAEGPDALGRVLHDLAQHPSTARFIATKLARHFVADEAPASLVARLEADFLRTQGDLPSLYRTLVSAPEAWSAAPAKLKAPEEFVISSARLLRLDEAFARQNDGGIGPLGQRVQAAPSPAGWPDRAAEWLGPDAVWKRVEWATRVAQRVGRQLDARALASASLGPWLHDETRRQIERAEDGAQALALLLLAPEFQRR